MLSGKTEHENLPLPASQGVGVMCECTFILGRGRKWLATPQTERPTQTDEVWVKVAASE